MKAYIKAIEIVLPEAVLGNEELAAQYHGWTADKIQSKTGILQRHIARADECSSDLAVAAARKLFSSGVCQPAEVDYVLLCTQSPDYFLPTTACLLQDRLALPTHCGALDFNLGCSGFVYGLGLAKGLIEHGQARNVMLLTAETYTKYIHPKDKGNRTIFGDGATATLVSTEGYAEIMNFSLGTDGQGAENLIVKSGAIRYPAPFNDLNFDEIGR